MRFQVFHKGQVVRKFDLYGAYLFGGDGISIRRADISFKNGFIDCKKPSMETSGLALLWPVEGFGKVLMPTTCLPERDKPYNLNVEIARGKLMQIIHKREDWSFFHSESANSNELFDQSQNLFVQAIQDIHDSSKASLLADESLKKGILYAEKLAILNSGSLFEIRGKNRGFGRGCIGCKVDLDKIGNPKYQEALFKLFHFVTIPIKWSQIEKDKGNFDFSKIDDCLKILGRKKLAVAGGPLLCFSEDHLPAWLKKGNATFEKIRETAYKFVAKVVSRYDGTIRAWRVINEMNSLNYFGFSFEQILEMTRAANMAVKASSDRSLKIIEVGSPWGEYYATRPNTIPPLVYIDMILQSGINFDAFGLQMRFGKDVEGMHIRDLMQISSVFDFFTNVAKPLYITEVEVPGSQGQDCFEGQRAGIWHKQWNPELQKLWIENFFKIALSKPFIDTVTYSHLVDDGSSCIYNSGLMTETFEPRESLMALKKLRQNIFRRSSK